MQISNVLKKLAFRKICLRNYFLIKAFIENSPKFFIEKNYRQPPFKNYLTTGIHSIFLVVNSVKKIMNLTIYQKNQ